MNCECHHEATDSHETCCGHDGGRNPDCPTHGDGSGPNAIRQPITMGELLDAAAAVDDNGQAFGAVINGMFSALEKMERGNDE